MELRPVQSEDLSACSEVYYAAEDELYERLNKPLLPRNPQALERLFGHILATDPDRCWLAQDGPRVVAFALAVRRDDLYFLSFLFVLPEHQGRGLGRRLLGRCLPADGYRATCVEAAQPVSTALYASLGLVPRTPIYTLIGRLRSQLPRLGDDLVLDPFASLAASDHAALAAQVDALDREVPGIARPQDHRVWLAWGRNGFLLRRSGDGQAIGYGYAHESGRVGPIVAIHEAVLLPLLGELLGRVRPVDAWQILVPGPARDTLVALLAAGLRLEGPPALFCATQPGLDHRRYLPASFALP